MCRHQPSLPAVSNLTHELRRNRFDCPDVIGYLHLTVLKSKTGVSTLRRSPQNGTGSQLRVLREWAGSVPISRFELFLQILRDDLPELVSVGDVKLDAGPVDVAFNGTNRDRQPFGDLPVREPCGDERGDLSLAGRHRQRLRCGPDRRRYRSAA